jgi:hypothetical protein
MRAVCGGDYPVCNVGECGATGFSCPLTVLFCMIRIPELFDYSLEFDPWIAPLLLESPTMAA